LQSFGCGLLEPLWNCGRKGVEYMSKPGRFQPRSDWPGTWMLLSWIICKKW
jgi:hypothetical protein